MTLIESNKNVNLGIKKDNIKVKDNFFAGVAAQGTGTATVKDDGSVEFKVNTFKLNDQIDIVAENRAASAAFVNQGTDLISDSWTPSAATVITALKPLPPCTVTAVSMT